MGWCIWVRMIATCTLLTTGKSWGSLPLNNEFEQMNRAIVCGVCRSCHSERSEESLAKNTEILRCAQNDRMWLLFLPILMVNIHHHRLVTWAISGQHDVSRYCSILARSRRGTTCGVRSRH